MRIASLHAAALAAAEHGWHVFPLIPGHKQPALHSRHQCPRTGTCGSGHQGWEQRATTDPDRIARCWSQAPYNVGIATGPSTLVVVDLDTASVGEQPPEHWRAPGISDGHDVLAALAAETSGPGADILWDTHTVATPSGGTHLYYTAPTGSRLASTNGSALGWKVDTRAQGGYIVAAGSTITGRFYRAIEDRQPSALPHWLIDRLTRTPSPTAPPPLTPRRGRPNYLDAAIRAETARVQQAPRRQRNSCLYVAALALGQLVAGGALKEDEVRQALLDAASTHITLGAYSHAQAHKTITSGLDAGANRPRKVAA